ncbi:hypothetical protein HL666_24305 [Bradyrhizobium sp. 83002]|uniref:hypothetical protein n=1 Tax=Bradyrhizobium aeschynomenes TaxID=2734909 RepID=UPI001557E51B|nr:hypothetical protein [Bradyrhizobium aeschynomenes]NPU13891.1 hypothetical protein [Bradyrhizobium aeschynomenes]
MWPRRRGLVAALAPFVIVLCAATAWAQSEPPLGLREAPQQPPQRAPAAEPASPPGNPGLVEELGKLFEKMAIIPLKRPSEADGERATDGKAAAAPADQAQQPPRQPAPKAGDDPASVLKDTGETLSRLAKPSTMISGRIVCPLAANGTPDCKLGADRLCQGKGYKEGKSLNTDSAETCSAKVLIPGRQRKPDDCRTDTFVTSALCQ